MSISDWSSDVCSSDLPCLRSLRDPARFARYAFASPLRGSLGQTVVPCSRIRLRCSACFKARSRPRARIHALRLGFSVSSHHITVLSLRGFSSHSPLTFLGAFPLRFFHIGRVSFRE